VLSPLLRPQKKAAKAKGKRGNAKAKKTFEISLPKSLCLDWARVVLENAKFPRGLAKSSPEKVKIAQLILGHGKVIDELWFTFTQERQLLHKGLLNHKGYAMAYLMGFHLANCARTFGLLQRLMARQTGPSALGQMSRQFPLRKLVREYAKVQIVDLGCGTGALSQALLAATGDAAGQCYPSLVDNAGVALDLARELLVESQNLTINKCHLENLPMSRYLFDPGLTIIGLSYVWNELIRNPKAERKLMDYLLRAKEKDTLIMILEPAQQHASRKIMALRDSLVANGFSSIYPCVADAPCPMLKRKRDWCYSEFTWNRPDSVVQVDRYLEIDRQNLAATGIVLCSPSMRQAFKRPDGRAVVVGRPLNKQGFEEYLLCKGDTLSKASKGRGNRQRRGELLAISP
jgi:SAM-dependent methyltransferase